MDNSSLQFCFLELQPRPCCLFQPLTKGRDCILEKGFVGHLSFFADVPFSVFLMSVNVILLFLLEMVPSLSQIQKGKRVGNTFF